MKRELKPWEVVASRHVWQDEWISLRADTCRTAGGVVIEPFYVLECEDWVHIVAFDAGRRILLTRLYRHGNRSMNLEIPAGTVEEGEEPEHTVRRELMEETGCRAGNLVLLGGLTPNSARNNNTVFAYAALDCERVAEPKDDPVEVVDSAFVAIDEVLEMIDRGAFIQSMHIAAIYMALRKLGWGPFAG